MISKHILLITFVKFIFFLLAVKLFQVFLSNTNDFIYC